MRSLRAVALAALVLGTTAGSASAQVLRFGQSFQAPGGTPVLESINTGVVSGAGGSSFVFELFAYDPVGHLLLGTALWQKAVGTPVEDNTYLEPGVALTGGDFFALLLHGDGGMEMYTSDNYMPGSGQICWDVDCSTGEFALEGRDINDFRLTWNSSAVPEPLTLLLLGSGLAGLAGARRRRVRE